MKRFVCSSDEIPVFFHNPLRPLETRVTWTVTSDLICLTPFGTLSTQAIHEVLADTESEAVSFAVAEIRKAYPGYTVETVTAEQKV
jgi:hypothetical protein